MRDSEWNGDGLSAVGTQGKTYQQRIEERWEQPLWSLLRDFAAQGLCRNDTARALGMPTGRLHLELARHAELDPFPPVISIPRQYFIDTGETFREACVRMASTHLISEAAREIGYTKARAFRVAMEARGICVTFQTMADRVRPKAPTAWRIPEPAVLRYAHLRIGGDLDHEAAAKVGLESSHHLRQRVRTTYPELWQQILVISRQHRKQGRPTMQKRAKALTTSGSTRRLTHEQRAD